MEGSRLLLGSSEQPSQPQHGLGDVGAAGTRPARQLRSPDDRRPGLSDGGHPPALLRQVDQVIREGILQAVGQVELLLQGPDEEAPPVAAVGPVGGVSTGYQPDLVCPRDWDIGEVGLAGRAKQTP